MGSTRLPGKVMKSILGTPMLFLQIERVMRARRINDLIVATTTEKGDDVLAAECERRGVAVFRGSAGDVLNRCVKAAEQSKPRAVVRLTGDCPLTDWNVIDLVVETFTSGGFQYVSNVDPPTYPDGLDVEVVDYSVLRTADAEARLSSEREHVTTFIRKHPERFHAANVCAQRNLSALRWTVDEPDDFELVRTVYEGLYPYRPAFETADILNFFNRRTRLTSLSGGLVRHAGLMKSEAAD
jgi:spore coat polysaccharide biosynthesis protein SpsF